jgi:hypothetical protein
LVSSEFFSSFASDKNHILKMTNYQCTSLEAKENNIDLELEAKGAGNWEAFRSSLGLSSKETEILQLWIHKKNLEFYHMGINNFRNRVRELLLSPDVQ